MSPKTDFIIVPTTHWDRDWYWPFERFRVKLIEMFERVLELADADPDYTFTVDGQSIAVEDYLEALPQRAERLRALGEQGRLKIGPLYVLSDVWLTGAEAMIRNLQIGRAIAGRFHASQDTVYQPDTFGFHPELPTLLAGCGLDTFMAMRGTPVDAIGDQRFFIWEGPDGSSVQVYRLRDGYANAARLGLTKGTGEVMDAATKASGIHPGFDMEMAVEKLGAACDKLRDGHGAPRLLLAGVDHQIPQRRLPDIIARAKGEDTAIHYGDLDAVAVGMRDHPGRGEWVHYRGELHDDSAHKLGGTVSSRFYLKQANATCERLLVRTVEPAAAVLRSLGIDEPAEACIELAWKHLLTVHPHDDITGCSVDAVHRENEAALARAHQAADALERRFAAHLVKHYGAQRPDDERHGFVLYNTDGSGGVQRVRVRIDCEGRYTFGDTVVPEHFAIVDEDGVEVPFRLLRRDYCSEHPHLQLELELSVALPPFRLRRFFIEARPRGVPGGPAVLENEHLRVAVADDGSATCTDLATGRTWSSLGIFGTQGDVGDEYTFSPQPGGAEALSPLDARHDTHQGLAGMQAARLSGTLEVRAWSSADGTRGEPVALPVCATWSLAPGERQVQVDLSGTNTANDHRLRWQLPLAFQPDESRAGHKLAEQVRPVRHARERSDGTLWLPIHPTDHYVAADDGEAGLAVFCEHPCEYEIVADAKGARLALTLVRAVGMLSVNYPAITRGPGAGPDTPTPEAQCRRDFAFRFAIRPYATGEDLLPAAMAWRSRPLRGVIWGADPDHRECDASLLAIDGGPVQLHACKSATDGNGVVIRLANPTAKEASATLRGIWADRDRLSCDHLERPLDRPAPTGPIPVPAWGLVSLRLV